VARITVRRVTATCERFFYNFNFVFIDFRRCRTFIRSDIGVVLKRVINFQDTLASADTLASLIESLDSDLEISFIEIGQVDLFAFMESLSQITTIDIDFVVGSWNRRLVGNAKVAA
jgi:hypothetical protein